MSKTNKKKNCANLRKIIARSAVVEMQIKLIYSENKGNYCICTNAICSPFDWLKLSELYPPQTKTRRQTKKKHMQ